MPSSGSYSEKKQHISPTHARELYMHNHILGEKEATLLINLNKGLQYDI
jgi:hypothetical protein